MMECELPLHGDQDEEGERKIEDDGEEGSRQDAEENRSDEDEKSQFDVKMIEAFVAQSDSGDDDDKEKSEDEPVFNNATDDSKVNDIKDSLESQASLEVVSKVKEEPLSDQENMDADETNKKADINGNISDDHVIKREESYRSPPRRPASRSGSRRRSRSWDFERAGRRRSRSRSRSEHLGRARRRRGAASQSRSPKRSAKERDPRDKPEVSNVLGAFGLSKFTKEKVLEHMFGKFGKLEKAVLVLDRAGHSKGYAFITFRHVQDAASARAALNRAVLDDREMRVDYSFTRRAHSPTPGCFRGRRDQLTGTPSWRAATRWLPRARSRSRSRRSRSRRAKSRRSRSRRSRSRRSRSRRSRSRRSRSKDRRSGSRPRGRAAMMEGLRQQDFAWRPREEREKILELRAGRRREETLRSRRSASPRERSCSRRRADVPGSRERSGGRSPTPGPRGRSARSPSQGTLPTSSRLGRARSPPPPPTGLSTLGRSPSRGSSTSPVIIRRSVTPPGRVLAACPTELPPRSPTPAARNPSPPLTSPPARRELSPWEH